MASWYLTGTISNDPASALQRSATEKRPVWIIAWDQKFQMSPEGKTNLVTDYNLHNFYSNPDTKKLIAEHFIQVFTTLNNKAIAQWIDPADKTHKPVYIILGADGKLIATKRHEGNAEVGLKTAQDIVAGLK